MRSLTGMIILAGVSVSLANPANVWADGSLPAQTLVPVPRLALDGMLFEVDATVVLE